MSENVDEYSHFKRIYDPKIIERIINIDTDPKRLPKMEFVNYVDY